MALSEMFRELEDAMAEAKTKRDALAALRADLQATIAQKQAAIDEAAHAYEDASTAVERLRTQANELMDETLGRPARVTVR